jgi:hypothetical protein
MNMPPALALAWPDVPIIGGEPHDGAPIAREFDVRNHNGHAAPRHRQHRHR